MDNKIVLIIIAILLPPLAVFLKQNNQFDKTVIINIILWLLFYVPGLIHALIVVL
ncbi:MAG: YqaE/Pmp3 family membrane protein [Coraliomargarita sp.]